MSSILVTETYNHVDQQRYSLLHVILTNGLKKITDNGFLFNMFLRRDFKASKDNHFSREEPDSILEHESQIYPRGGYNSISNRGSIHNIYPLNCHTDIDISSPMNPHHLNEIDCTNENANT